jgi:hypothetical protein
VPGPDTTPPAAPANLRVTYSNPYLVALAWNANAEPDLWAYEVYRDSAAGPQAFTRIGRVLAPTTVFTDDTVVAGSTYSYTLKAVDLSFNRSGNSNVVTATAAVRMVQVTFNAVAPAFTPVSETLHLAGSFPAPYPQWDPSGLPMTRTTGTTWALTLTLPDGLIIGLERGGGGCKYTRGSWSASRRRPTATRKSPIAR